MNKILLVLFLAFFCVVAQASSLFEKYFLDTYQCLDKMRNNSSALVVDSVNADLKTLTDSTSPTNIALDLLVQLEAMKHPALKVLAQKHINQILKTLEQVDFHQASGLFFVRYSSDGNRVTDKYLSTIDNFHLAFALWVLKDDSRIAEILFARMDFSFLYDERTGLFAGGAHHSNHQWKIEEWNYDFLGSEGRSLYGLGWAIGIISDKDYLKKIMPSLMAEMNGPILRLWDGGAFQLLLPRLLFNEERYSKVLKKSFLAYGQFILKEGKRLSYPVPAAFSASQVTLTSYNGKAGSPSLVSVMNLDILNPTYHSHWDEVFTPHAAILAAPLMPAAFTQALIKAESVGGKNPLYRPGLGWLDGLHVKGQNKGVVVPVYLSLDQGMIALASAQVLSQNGMTEAAMAILNNKRATQKLKLFYQHLDIKLQTSL